MKYLFLICLLVGHWTLSSITTIPVVVTSQKTPPLNLDIELQEKRLRYNKDRVDLQCKKLTIIEQQQVIIENIKI